MAVVYLSYGIFYWKVYFQWEEAASWYPGYLWKPCVCPECAAFIGCVFQPVQPGLIVPSETFYGLLLRTLVSESCKYNLFLLVFNVWVWICVCRFKLWILSDHGVFVICIEELTTVDFLRLQFTGKVSSSFSLNIIFA